MRVIMKVLDVDVQSIKNDKEKLGKITLKSEGSEAITVMMFNKDIEAGKAGQLVEMEGKLIVTDIEVDIREGNISYRFGYNAIFAPHSAYVKNAADRLLNKPTPAPAAKAS